MSVGENSLAGARSAYLRSARHQPVRWMEWGPEAFARAAAEGRPVLLDIGAVWCHWCHVMDRESYENAETARLINDHFVAIKVDRDERPDVDARYQAAVAVISGQGGWPLTAFLTPAGEPFFGGTYFPPLDGHGRPGLRRVLMTMAEAWQRRPDEVLESGSSVMEAIEQNETFDGGGPAADAGLVERIVASALGQFDSRHGGFGAQPKFPHPAALDLLLAVGGRPGAQAEEARRAALSTLDAMRRGGVYDHLAGGFHRYSVDERWVVPHFEKMSYDNSELLRNYVHAWQNSGDGRFAQVARECIGWVDGWLSDRERGGFYASQDADESLHDDGDYFTWTLAEAAAVLTPAELSVAGPYFDVGELGDMQHNPRKNVLHIDHALEAVAARAGVESSAAELLLLSAKQKLGQARLARPAPFIDRTLYTGWNAMMISAYLDAGRVLGEAEVLRFGLLSLDRALAAAWDGLAVGHVIAYGDGSGPGREAGVLAVPGVLDDYAFLGLAALDGWTATGRYAYFEAALGIGSRLLEGFCDRERGGFFDTPTPTPGEVRLGALRTRRKPLQDSPTPAGNPTAATLLLRLEALTGRAEFREAAAETLACFAGVVEHFGLYAGSFGLALERMILPAVQVVVLGSDAAADALEQAALDRYAVSRTVIRLREHAVLPPALAGTVPLLPGFADGKAQAMVCVGQRCLQPVSDAAALRELLGRADVS